ncbi:MAG: AMP-binding protein [Phyllobacteriaceae bacterium]|nr:AMP-binding protein [Phyllobacteriaceae bacterium]
MRFAGDTFDAIVRDFSWDLPELYNIGVACCDDWAVREPGRVALRRWRDDGPMAETTYGELAELSDRLANGLSRLGASAGDRVAIVLPQRLETVAAHLAIYKSAMIAVPLARLFQPEALEYRLARAGVSIVVTDADGAAKIRLIRERLPELRHVVVIGDGANAAETGFDDLVASTSAGFTAAVTTPDTPALIIFTSGTTGPPKGALHGHRVVIGHLPGLMTHHEFMPQPGDMAWTPADWAWAGGLLNILLPCLMLGVPVVYGGLDRFDPEKAFRLMSEAGVRNAFIPPTALRLMRTVEAPARRFALTLRTVGSGGESLGAATHEWAQRELGLRVNEFYGQTECNLVLSCFGAAGVMKAGSIGKAVPGHDVAVIDDSGGVCPSGVRGEVAISRPDPVMFLGYWRDEAATAKKYRGDWLLTGDQAVVDAEGYYQFVGRDDDIINVAGYRVGPGEIEDSLITHPAVRLAAAVGKPDALKGEIVKAYVVLAPGHEASAALADDIRRHVKARLAANIYPREVEFVDDIPLTTTGKVIRRLFRDKAKAESLSA